MIKQLFLNMEEDGGLSCKRLFLGGATVAAAKAAAAPAERVKILLQVQVSRKAEGFSKHFIL